MSELDFKATLLMPETAFEMRANLSFKEPSIQKSWLDLNVYQIIRSRKNKSYILHDGPPYANGDLHVGHALNKILKDIILRSKVLRGFHIDFIPGWDTHGLPIEHAILKKNPEYAKLSKLEFRKLCEKFALDNIEIQLAQFKKLGLLTDFSKIYRTLDPDFEANQIKTFYELYEQGLIVKKLKPVIWSPTSRTALANAEVEYQDVESDSIYVAFKTNLKDYEALIWTSTPWTIPSNLAIGINPKLNYVAISYGKRKFIIAKPLLNQLQQLLTVEEFNIIEELKIEDILNSHYFHPLYNRKSKFLQADFVSDLDGTGLVHLAPGFGEDDYFVCKANKIDVYCPINEYGKFSENINDNDLVNKFYLDANPIVINKLGNQLIHHKKFKHSVAHDWRTKKPTMFRATIQWFVSLQPEHIEKIKTIFKDSKSTDSWMLKNLEKMVLANEEWCISRQRTWGVPIPILYDVKTNVLFNEQIKDFVIQEFKTNGSNIWYEKEASYFCSDATSKEVDIMDVWFDSGTSYNILKENGLKFPADLYLEGNDQYRGWFNSSSITSCLVNNQLPMLNVLSHGMVLDANNQKMSKSLGNVIDPLEVTQQLGADVLRLWVSSVNYKDNVNISKDILNQTSENYRKIRNTLLRFSLGNISHKDSIIQLDKEISRFELHNKLLLYKLSKQVKLYEQLSEEFNFNKLIKEIINFTNELSSWYFEIVKDVLYCDEESSLRRQEIQFVIEKNLLVHLYYLAPVLPHTVEELFTYLPKRLKLEKSFFLTTFNFRDYVFFDIEIAEFDNLWTNWTNLSIMTTSNKTLSSWIETLRSNKVIKKNTEAKLTINININKDDSLSNKTALLLLQLQTENRLTQFLNVGLISLNVKSNISELTNVEVSSIDNITLHECERCWKHFVELSKDNLCSRCQNLITKLNK